MVVKNNYFWKDEEKKIDFIANGDIVKVERILGTEEVHGHRFADVDVSLPDYGDIEMQVKVLLGCDRPGNRLPGQGGTEGPLYVRS